MDRLPFELLGHISDCISLEPLPQLRQGSLASLSRTNKTFYTATRPTLYRDPVLLSDWRARCYEKTIGNKVNPWLLSGSRRKEKQWWVPRSLSFEFPTPPLEAFDRLWPRPMFQFQEPGCRYCPRFESLSPHLDWSNLTSLNFSNCLVDAEFLATVLGPRRSSRRTIVSLNFHDTHPHSLLFLFDSGHFLKSVQTLFVHRIKTGVDYPIDEDSKALEVWERHEGGQSDKEAWTFGNLPKPLWRKARFDYKLWQRYLNYDFFSIIETETSLAAIRFSQPSEYPFSALSFLSLQIYYEVEYQLIFYTPLFPSLRVLIICADELFETLEALNLYTFRYSVTRRNGSGALVDSKGETLQQIEPLSKAEERDYPLKPYRGPNLSKLKVVDFRPTF